MNMKIIHISLILLVYYARVVVYKAEVSIFFLNCNFIHKVIYIVL